MLITSSYKKRFPTPSLYSLAILELVQAQGCPVVCLGRVYVDWLDKASFGPGCELGSCILGGFCIPVSFDRPPWMVRRELQAEVVRLLVLLRAMLCTRRRLNTTEPQRQRAARAAAALYHRLCTWPS